MMAMRDGTFANRRPNPPRHRLQADAMLVGGEDFNRFVRVFRGFFRDGLGEFF